MPIVVLPKDGAATIQTMVSVSDAAFNDGRAFADGDNGWRVEVDSPGRRLIPTRAYAIAKDGVGLLAIFRGGEEDDWIEPAWQSVRDKLTFPDHSDIDQMVANGASASQKLAQDGLKSYLPDMLDEMWWIACLNTPDRGFGWLKFTPGASSLSFEWRALLETELQQSTYEWRGPLDLKSYRVIQKYKVSDSREKDAQQGVVGGFDATLKAGKVELHPQGGSRALTYTVPPNYVPGGWLPMILPKLVDRPMIIRTDSFSDYAFAQPRDFLTITLRPEPNQARPTDDSGTKLQCVSVQVSGSVEKALWFYRPDGTLDGADYPDSQHMIRSDEHDIAMQFAHNESLKPSN
jgi:hypothetical protein